MEGSEVAGGFLIVHQLNEGKHQYEVKSVFKPLKKPGEKFFVRKGDKLRLVNETELQDVPPEDLAQILSKGNPLLTVHKTMRKKEPHVVTGEDVMVPVSKEEMTLFFRPGMIREELLGQDNLHPTEGDEDDVCTEEGVQTDFLVVSMKKTSISVLAGRGCQPSGPCHECTAQCEYNDVVMVTESSTVTLVARGGGSLRHLKCSEAVVEHMSSSLYIRSVCQEKRVYVAENPERITIYYYKSDAKTNGLPVVLNFSGSDCFLKCCKNGETVQLQVERCDKQILRSISRSDQHALAFVFYMKSERTRITTFESALYSGWLIQVSDCGVEMVKTAGPQEENFFYIIIQKGKG
uniref:Interleukin-1 beta n=1 Tax=Neogobius melanostomus TaxID=47308 RepID=A0A8C6USV2_9GOBI